MRQKAQAGCYLQLLPLLHCMLRCSYLATSLPLLHCAPLQLPLYLTTSPPRYPSFTVLRCSYLSTSLPLLRCAPLQLPLHLCTPPSLWSVAATSSSRYPFFDMICCSCFPHLATPPTRCPLEATCASQLHNLLLAVLCWSYCTSLPSFPYFGVFCCRYLLPFPLFRRSFLPLWGYLRCK
jgi:hypothetical protein